MGKITVEGTITINGVDSKFRIDNDINDSWFQWGATQDRLSDSVYIVESLQTALMENVGYHNEEE
tara:strand:- start:599 stop:793 length:195 start_codon:yes stop_codon:yes gene_type:complete